jgi:molybdopterin synthase sulfur carrier subunit|tara:strand:+ start:1627 stop:1854 length:228 start_codon:yes stop_codon:yes gene_type:complete
MSIQVKFFASLKETLNIDDHDIKSATTAGEAWDIATTNAERPDNLLVAINLEYAQFESTVKDGDEIAFFPPVTGG